MKRLLPLIFLILAAGTFFMYTDKSYENLKQLRLTHERYAGILDQSKQLIARREDIRRAYNAIPAEDIERLNKFLPSTVDNVRLVLDITSIARKRGILVSNISIQGGQGSESAANPSLSEQTEEYGTITVSFRFDADYATFVQFLRDLEVSMRLVDITDLSIANDAKSILYKYDITLKTYWLR